MTRTVLLSLVLAVGLPMGCAQAEESVPTQSNDRVIGPDMDVALDYTLTVEGVVVDSTAERGPLRYIHGQGQLFPALERQLEGLHVGDERNIVVAPKDAYGMVDPKAFQEVPKSRMPKDLPLEVGTQLQATSQDGRVILVTVSEAKKDAVVLNFNHPLAGKELHFKVKILDIQ